MPSHSYKIIIVDDEPRSCEYLAELLKDIPEAKIIARHTNPVKALDDILLLEPDIVFLDIEMPKMTGMELASRIHQENLFPKIIFVTAFQEFAIQAFKHSAFDFLVKPAKQEDLVDIFKRIRESHDHRNIKQDLLSLMRKINNNHKLHFATRTGLIIVNTSEILYCQADRNYSHIFLTADRKEILTMNLSEVEKLLPENSFCRLSRSLLINLDYLSKFDRVKRSCILFYDGREYCFEVPVKKLKGVAKKLEIYP